MELLWPFTLFAFSMAFTPGPNNTMLVASGLNHGFRPTFPHQMGVVIGYPSMVAAIGFGFASLLVTYPGIRQGIQVVGVLYLLFLAWLIATTSKAQDIEKRPPLTFLQAALFQWVNPKAWMMVASSISTYTTVAHPMYQQLIWIILISFFVGIGSTSTWLFLGASLKKFITQPQHIRWFNYTMAFLLVCSVLPVIFQWASW